MRKTIWLILVSLLLSVFSFGQEKMPQVAREFRGMWAATVYNLDFPTKQNLTADQQKAELVKLVDLAEELKLNAIVFQVRSMGDAVYFSEIEPASPFVTGTLGKKAEFDPLQFLINEAHGRGILVHAWFNPYRASHPSYTGEIPNDHVTVKHQEWIRPYSNYKMIDPGVKEARDYVTNVVMDVVKRYDIDGVHFDDYFYPYLDANKTDFPDSISYDAYKNAGGKLAKSDWRRKNVDDFIQTISVEIKKIKPAVMFGVSPFGIWKPDETIGIKGLSSFDVQYADSRKWMQEGWVDYMTPQLYWSTTKDGQQFAMLLKWWDKENKKKRHLWAGIAPYKVGDANYTDYSSKEIETQIGMTRTLLKDNAGTIHFRALSLAANKDSLKDNLRDKVYRSNSLIPLTPWIKTEPLKAPEISFEKQTNGNILAIWKNSDSNNKAFRWILYWDDGKSWKYNNLPPYMNQADLPANLNIKKVGIASVDRLGNISNVIIKEVK